MGYEEFFRHIDLFRQRVESLQQKATSSKRRPSLLIETLTALQTAGEELQSAKEELQQQNDELGATQRYLVAERQRYQAFFDFAPEAYLVTDQNGIICQANLAAVTQLSIPARRLIGKPLGVFIAQADRHVFRTQLAHLPPFPDKLTLTLAIQPRSGDAFQAAVVAGRLPECESAQSKLCWQIRNMTARQSAAQQAGLDERWSILRTLAERVVHQIGNALNGLSTTVQLQQRYLNSTAGLRLSLLRQTGQDLSHELARLRLILEEWRTFVRRPQLRLQPVFLPDLVDDVLLIQSASSIAHNVHLETDISATPPKVPADPELLRQALEHVYTNAVEAMPEGGVLTVRLTAQQEHVCIKISDTGSGVTLQGDIFAPLTTTKASHAGLGLALTKQIVHAHGGTLTYMPAPEGGSEFCITLPIQP